ncbi:3-keto-5-aminohexanoate cleavage protein [Niveibacterium umoris]|uniref:Uncharacterized protein (DUF849 family) n=1 Tax=Niveibacterium umoris TaxID=1193620 RepID=A0A840BNZ7_9RHOO|nr:3-keto-5-aminohexanoate cleavage protein [Niveibacterium umoris]MBB4012576.1 uncharacterized protein (DUF849 family) [Niveibacterium umoris]
MTEPLIINLAPTGMIPTRELTPHAPLHCDEILADVSQCVAAGASMLHIHARDEGGAPTSDAHVFAEIITRIRELHPSVVVTATTSGRKVTSFEKRAEVLWLKGAAKPDMASLTLGSLNFVSGASVNDPTMINRLAQEMKAQGIKPELEVFDLGMVHYAHVLIDKGLIEPPYYFNILLGNIGTAQASLSHLTALVTSLPPDSVWSLAGLGRFQAHANAMGVVHGHGVRTGLEDNLHLDAGRTRLATNLDLVQRVVRQAEAMERPIATPLEVRRRLGLAMP